MEPRRRTSWSVPLGRVAGIRLRLHLSFFLLLLLVLAAGGTRTPDGAVVWSGSAMVGQLLWIAAVFVCVVIHELSHSVVARRLGVEVRDILLLPIGGVSEMERMPDEPRSELAISAAGPAASLLLALGGLGAATALGHTPWPPALFSGPWLGRLGWLNALLAGFNLLPALPLDGGRILRSALALRLGRPRATDLAVSLGRAGGLVLVALGVMVDFWVAIIGAFVYLGATAEGRAAQARRALSGLVVRDVMLWSPWVAGADELVTPAAAEEAVRRQGGLPVSALSRYVGLIGPAQAPRLGLGAPAAEAADRSAPTVGPLAALDSVLDLFRNGQIPGLPVLDADGCVVGMLRVQDVARAASAHPAAGDRRGVNPDPVGLLPGGPRVHR